MKIITGDKWNIFVLLACDVGDEVQHRHYAIHKFIYVYIYFGKVMFERSHLAPPIKVSRYATRRYVNVE